MHGCAVGVVFSAARRLVLEVYRPRILGAAMKRGRKSYVARAWHLSALTEPACRLSPAGHRPAIRRWGISMRSFFVSLLALALVAVAAPALAQGQPLSV